MALQDVLAGFANPAASRAAILQRLGIDPNRAAGYGGNTEFDQTLANLYSQGLQTASSLDTQEGDLNRGYEKNVAQAAIDRDRALQTIKGNMAQRGLTFSGASIDELGRANSDFDRYLADLASSKESGLAAIARNRTNLEQGLTSGRMAAESGYGSDLQAFLQQQAIDLWNSVMAQNAAAAANRPAPAAPRPSAPRPSAPAPRLPAPVAPAAPQLGSYGGQYIKPDVVVNRTPVPPKKPPLTPLRGIY